MRQPGCTYLRTYVILDLLWDDYHAQYLTLYSLLVQAAWSFTIWHISSIVVPWDTARHSKTNGELRGKPC